MKNNTETNSRSLIQNFIQKPAYSVLLILFLFSAGLWGVRKLPVNLFPGLNYPLINVITQYSGISTEDMELLVTNPIENELQGIRGVRRTSSISTIGISQVTVEFSQGYDLLAARQLVSAALSRIAGQLPVGVNPVIDNLGSRIQQIIGYTFINTNIPQSHLRQVIRYHFIPGLHSVPGISRIDIMGGKRAAYVIEPDINRLRQLNMSITDLKKILRENNINISGRYLEQYYLDVPIRGIGQIQTIDDVRYLRIKTAVDGNPILMKDIARVTDASLPEHYSVLSNNQPAVAVLIQKENGFSALSVANGVNEKIKQLSGVLPPGTEIRKFYDQSEILQESVNGVKSEIILGGILAVLVLFVFLRRWAPTFIVALTIPLALFASAALMLISNYSFNMMTLAALTLSIGMVVDDSIIVMENIDRHLKLGEPLNAAVVNGTRQIVGPDISGTLTTVIVFLPLLFLPGFLGSIIRPFGVTVSYTLLVSLLLSISIIPALMRWKGAPAKKESRPPRFLTVFSRINDRFFVHLMDHKKRFFTGLLLLFIIIIVVMVLCNPVGFLPNVDEGAILVEYVMRPGVALHESQRVGSKLVAEVLKLPDVANVYLKIGSPENTYYIENVNHGELLIKLKQKNKRRHNVDEIMDRLRMRFATVSGTVFLFHQPTEEKIDESFSGLPAFFGVTVSGSNLDSLIDLSTRVEQAVQETGGFANIINNAKFMVPQIEIIPKRLRLVQYKLSMTDVMQQLSQTVRGEVVSWFVKEQMPIAVFLRLPEPQRQRLADLKILPITTADGLTIPLDRIADIRYRDVMPAITHLNSQREVTLVAEPEGNIFSIIRRLKEKLNKIKLPAGYAYQIRGQYQTLLKSLQDFALIILAAIILVYIILYLQFNSFWQPFVILLKIPLDFVGAFFILFLTRQPLNISVAIGLLTLIGLAVNNAIILIDMANKLRAEQGLPHRDALLQAVHIRTRPILMTGLTTIFGLLPAAIGMGIGSKIHQPFALTLIGGMIAGIFFSLNIIPALYETIGKLVNRLE